MSLYSDFINFVDGGSKVKYFVDGGVYRPLPLNIDEKFEFDFKQYYKSSDGCFVGIASYGFVRKIFISDYKKMKSLYLESLEIEKKIKERVQLTLF